MISSYQDHRSYSPPEEAIGLSKSRSFQNTTGISPDFPQQLVFPELHPQTTKSGMSLEQNAIVIPSYSLNYNDQTNPDSYFEPFITEPCIEAGQLTSSLQCTRNGSEQSLLLNSTGVKVR